jgi:hypothetical protein
VYGSTGCAAPYWKLDQQQVAAVERGGRRTVHARVGEPADQRATVGVTPALERLELGYQAPDDQWLALVGRGPSALHWIEGYYAGSLDALRVLLRDETVEARAAAIHLRTGG